MRHCPTVQSVRWWILHIIQRGHLIARHNLPALSTRLPQITDHRRNLAEKAIQTWKDHFVSVFSGTADSSPLHLWCQIITLLRQSYVVTKILVYAYLYGGYNYSTMPFVPIGMEMLIHKKPRWRKTFVKHCVKAYGLSTSPENYRCWDLWVREICATRVLGTVFHKHKSITNPTIMPEDAVMVAANNLGPFYQGTLCLIFMLSIHLVWCMLQDVTVEDTGCKSLMTT